VQEYKYIYSVSVAHHS